jgi:hypothetical protein
MGATDCLKITITFGRVKATVRQLRSICRGECTRECPSSPSSRPGRSTAIALWHQKGEPP